jgi:hypothetical protein
MKKLFRMAAMKLFCLFKGTFCGGLVSIAPVALIHHKDLNSYFSSLHWSVIIFFVLSILTAGISFFLLPSLPAKKIILAIGYLFFYTACAALCQRIGLTSLAIDPYQHESHNISAPLCQLTIIPGTILICLAAIYFVTTAIHMAKNSSQDKKKIAHSHYLSWLLFMSGIPLIFGVWLPLLAIPGAWVTICWLD